MPTARSSEPIPGCRLALHFNVAEGPTARWVIQQLRENREPTGCSPYLMITQDDAGRPNRT